MPPVSVFVVKLAHVKCTEDGVVRDPRVTAPGAFGYTVAVAPEVFSEDMVLVPLRLVAETRTRISWPRV
jgi:hypothetical protein